MIWRLLSKLLAAVGRRLPAVWQESLIERIVQARVQSGAPDEGLRFLFGLEAMMYSLEGPLAVQYGKGIHPKHGHTRYHDFFVSRIRKDERVLDVGCGIGAVAYDIAKRAGADVTGVDYNAGSIAAAKQMHQHPRLEFKVGDVLELDAGTQYDTIVLSNVLEHIVERVVFLKDLRQKTGARHFLIRVPLFERDWRVPLKKELGVEWRLDLDHKTEHTLEAFQKETSEAGLTVRSIQTPWGEIWAELDAA